MRLWSDMKIGQRTGRFMPAGENGCLEGAEKVQKDKITNNETTNKQTRIHTVIMLIGLILIIFACFNLVKIIKNYYTSRKIYGDLNQQYVTEEPVSETVDGTEEEKPWYELASVDLKALQEQNPEVAGWIYFENEDISYPVMYSGDNEKYLRTTWNGVSASAGSLFIEEANSPDFEDCHTLIYGHNMKDLSMFGKLKYYKEKDAYYEDHQFFQIFSGNEISRYQIFADVDADSFVYSVPYAEDDAFQDFIDEIYKISYKQTGVTATNMNKVITLSTCSNDDKRFVVHAVRVNQYNTSEGETE